LRFLYDVATPQEASPFSIASPYPAKASTRRRALHHHLLFRLVSDPRFEHAGRATAIRRLLQTWRDLLKLNYTTWPESRGDTRSDTHAWSAHPTADLLGVVAGIRPGAPGYARVRIAPVLGDLTSLDAAAATPKGVVSVKYKVEGGKLTAVIDRPAALPGEFVWKGQTIL
jgi:hypothetical protein